MEEVAAPDPRTVVIRWKQPYPEAVSLDRDFQALPRHILAAPFRDSDPIAFASHPFWTTEYVGLGPYRMTAWEPGTHILGSAFDGYVLGRPKIDQVRVLFISDPQTALANILSGEVHLIADPIFGVTEGLTIEQQWAQNKGGVVLYSPVGPRTAVVQMRPEYVDSAALLNARVRTAIAHGMDTPSAIEILTSGKALETFSITHPRSRDYPEVERAIVKHEYNPRRAQQVLDEAGFRKGADGFYTGADGKPIQFGLYSSAGERQEAEVTVYVDSLRQVGFDAVQKVTSVQEIRDPRLRAVLGGIQMRGGGDHIQAYTTEQIPRPETRWHGDNRGGWSNPEYDRLVGLYLTTLERPERLKILAQAERIRSEDAGVFPRQFNAYVVAHVAGLTGPVARNTAQTGDTFLHIQKWEWITRP
jgi:peptide/nickel transport system substrate-binding protein